MTDWDTLLGIEIILDVDDKMALDRLIEHLKSIAPNTTFHVKDAHKRLSGDYAVGHVFQMLRNTTFTDGEIYGFYPRQDTSWLIIQINRSTHFRVYVGQESTRTAIEDNFPPTRHIPERMAVANPDWVQQSALNAPYSFVDDIQYQSPCPYCGKIINYIGMVDAVGCVDSGCDFWTFHRQEHGDLCFVLHFFDK
jgi:hypothetical protein